MGRHPDVLRGARGRRVDPARHRVWAPAGATLRPGGRVAVDHRRRLPGDQGAAPARDRGLLRRRGYQRDRACTRGRRREARARQARGQGHDVHDAHTHADRGDDLRHGRRLDHPHLGALRGGAAGLRRDRGPPVSRLDVADRPPTAVPRHRCRVADRPRPARRHLETSCRGLQGAGAPRLRDPLRAKALLRAGRLVAGALVGVPHRRRVVLPRRLRRADDGAQRDDRARRAEPVDAAAVHARRSRHPAGLPRLRIPRHDRRPRLARELQRRHVRGDDRRQRRRRARSPCCCLRARFAGSS